MSNYTKEEHEKFLQKVNENPQNYDYGGEHHPNAKTFYPDGSVSVGGIVPRDKWVDDWSCPECGSNGISQKTLGGHPWVECEDCGWIGGNKEEDCNNEIKINNERLKKLNDILS
jgi:predicted RNA-binding Zn-ribbon protein involved in translation (DUF1610 family)